MTDRGIEVPHRDDGESIEKLLHQAGLALYEARQAQEVTFQTSREQEVYDETGGNTDAEGQ